jgi:hypothetical protein
MEGQSLDSEQRKKRERMANRDLQKVFLVGLPGRQTKAFQDSLSQSLLGYSLSFLRILRA